MVHEVARLWKPRLSVEIGAYVGYSAMSLCCQYGCVQTVLNIWYDNWIIAGHAVPLFGTQTSKDPQAFSCHNYLQRSQKTSETKAGFPSLEAKPTNLLGEV